MYKLFRPFIFKLDPENAHSTTLRLLRLVGTFPPINFLIKRIFQASSTNSVTAFGLKFKNPIGLAAGYDKDGEAIIGLSALGLGHIEVGTITPKPQIGNPKKRVFRLVKDKAIINRMGFPSLGAKAVLANLEKTKKPKGLILGINIGKNKDTSLSRASEDYNFLISTFNHLADYFAINISSPNTIGLRDLQAKEHLHALLEPIVAHRNSFEKQTPLLVKLAPDLNEQELKDAVEVILESKIDGIIATNTTIGRDGLLSKNKVETGGLSGSPLTNQSTDFIRKIYQYSNGQIPIIAVGGVMTARDAKEKLDAGATLVQVFTGLIYSGPSLIKNILNKLKH